MAASNRDRERWIDSVCTGLRSEFQQLGFLPSGRRGFVKKAPGVTRTWELNWRFPKSADDPHALYLDPCIGVNLAEIDATVARLTDEPIRKGYATIGGTIGVFGPTGTMVTWPMDDDRDIPHVVVEFTRVLHSVAAPFWDALASPALILAAIREDSPYANLRSNAIVGLAACGLSEGRAAAEAFVETHHRWLRSQSRGVPKDLWLARVREVFQ